MTYHDKFWWDFHRLNDSPITVESVEPAYAVVAVFPFEGDATEAIAKAEALIEELVEGRANPLALSREVPNKYRWHKPPHRDGG